MAKDTSLTVSLFGRDVSFGKVLNGAGKQAKTAEQSFKTLSRGATIAFGAITAAATLSVKAAMEDQQAAVQLAQTLKNTMGATKAQTAAVEDYISKLSISAAKTDDEIRPAYDRLIRSTGSYTKTQRLMNLAIQISYSKNKPLVDVANALAKANDGNVKALAKMGVSLPKATKAQVQYGTAMKVVNGRLTTVTVKLGTTKKAVQSLDSLLPGLEKGFKNSLGAASATAAFKMKQFQIGMNELKETIGYELLPTFNKFVKMLPGLLSFLERNKETIKKLGTVVLALSGFVISVNAALKVFHALQTVKMFAGLIARWAGFTAAVEASGTGIAAAGVAADVAWAPFLLTIGTIAAAFVGINLVLDKLEKKRKAILNDPNQMPSWTSQSNKFFPNTEMRAVPKHAKGGIVTKPHIGMVGEAGPEAIIPLNKANGLGGITIINNIRGSVMAEKELALVIRNDIAQLMRRKGLNPAILGV
jgi:hypothetical protein